MEAPSTNAVATNAVAVSSQLLRTSNSTFKYLAGFSTNFSKRFLYFGFASTNSSIKSRESEVRADSDPASNPAKKYMIYDPKNNKWVNFGQLGYEDYTKHGNKTRRKNYLTRTKGMLGDWKNNKYSANNLSRHILWP